MNLPATALRTAAGALAGTGLLTAAVVGVQHASPASATTTSAAAHPAASGASAKDDKAPRCRTSAVRAGKKPDALKKDLAAARARIKDSDAKGAARRTERREALEAVRKAALDGKYGEVVQLRVEAHQKMAEARRAALPAALRADLEALQKMDPGPARREAAKKLRAARLDGTYGAQVEERAEKQQQRRTACQAQRQDRRAEKAGKADGGSSPS